MGSGRSFEPDEVRDIALGDASPRLCEPEWAPQGWSRRFSRTGEGIVESAVPVGRVHERMSKMIFDMDAPCTELYWAQ
jgi:hypothetical protein